MKKDSPGGSYMGMSSSARVQGECFEIFTTSLVQKVQMNSNKSGRVQVSPLPHRSPPPTKNFGSKRQNQPSTRNQK